jgi:hypothetical protein
MVNEEVLEQEVLKVLENNPLTFGKLEEVFKDSPAAPMEVRKAVWRLIRRYKLDVVGVERKLFVK